MLRHVVRETRKRWPFHIDARMVLPEHLHCVWTLPAGDDDDNASRCGGLQTSQRSPHGALRNVRVPGPELPRLRKASPGLLIDWEMETH